MCVLVQIFNISRYMYVCILFSLGLKDQIRKVCAEEYLVCGEGDEQGGAWQEKVIYFFLIYML